MKGKELIKKIKELGIEKDVLIKNDCFRFSISDIEVKNDKIILK